MTPRREQSEAPSRAARGPMWRLLGFARPYAPLLAAVAIFTLLFAAGRFARAYLMKPLLDGILVPVAEGEAPAAPTGLFAADPREAPPDDWLSRGLERALPDRAAHEAGDPARASIRAVFRDLLVAAFAIVIISPIALFGRAYLSEYVLGRINIDLKQALARTLLQLPLDTLQRERTGDLLSRAQSDADASREALKLVLQEYLVSITMIGIGLATLLFLSVPLTAISLLAAPSIVGVLAIFGRRIRRSARRRQEQLGQVTSRLLRVLSGIKVIKAFGGEAMEAEVFARETRRLLRRDLRVVFDRVFSRAVVEALNSAAGIAMLVIGAWLVLHGRFGLTTGDVAAFATVLATTYKPIKNLSKGHSKLMECLSSAERLFAVLDRAPEPADPPNALPLGPVEVEIRFCGVHLVLGEGEDARTVLQDIDLSIPAGRVVGIVGRTGAGKTSFVDLLMRFHEPSAGRIELDGVPLDRYARTSLRSRIAIVGQEPFLFDATIRENIRYGRPDAGDAEVEAAARAAHVDEFSAALEAGLDTEVGEFGARLSGGQRQRITIARALLRAPTLLIFDEATSALDALTERTVHEAIEHMRGRCTVLIVTHRLATVASADQLVVLENGRVSAHGPPDRLRTEPGLYRELSELQAPALRAETELEARAERASAAAGRLSS